MLASDLIAIFIILIVIMLLAMTPPLLWFVMNIKKYRETYSLKFKRIVFWSWFVCYGLAMILALVILIIVYA